MMTAIIIIIIIIIIILMTGAKPSNLDLSLLINVTYCPKSHHCRAQRSCLLPPLTHRYVPVEDVSNNSLVLLG
jgi:hypothetical protein